MVEKRRKEFHLLLEALLGSTNVYYQPPESVKLNYPCLVYERALINSKYADNRPYAGMIGYDVTLMDYSPDSLFIEKLWAFPYSQFGRHFTLDRLNHDVFTIYY